MTVVPMHGKGTAEKRGVLAALDIGSSKISCVIAESFVPKHRIMPGMEKSSLRVLGVGHQLSRGVKAGAIIDADEAERAIRLAVDAAERMAQRSISEVYVNVSGGRPQSFCHTGTIDLMHGVVAPRDIDKAVAAAVMQIDAKRRTILHIAPSAFMLDGARGSAPPVGMHGEKLSVELGIVTVDTAHLRNLAMVLERAHLLIAGHVIAPYAAGRAVLADDEMHLGTVLIEVGGSTTSYSVFHEGRQIFSDSVPVGGMHITNDVARGLSTTVAHAERMKTLWGAALSANGDELDMLSVPQLGERGVDTVQKVPRSMLTSIIRPRVDEIFEMLAQRLSVCPVAHLASQNAVLSGGASQLPGMREVAASWINRQVRLASPMPLQGMPDAISNPGFSVVLGLVAYALKPDKHYAMPAKAAASLAQAQQSYVARVGRWIADSF
jgi:cell division protein FtsA